jgi:DNA-binding SARP family transcriptional activator
MGITALLLGPWNDGPTLHITATGHLRPTPQDQGDGQGDDDPTDRNDEDDAAADDGGADDGAERIAVLDVPATWTLLHTLREAHTGQRPAPEHRPAPTPGPAPDPADPAAGPIAGPPRPPAEPVDAAAEPRATAVPVPTTDAEHSDPSTHPAPAAGPRAHLRVLGDPAVLNATAEGRALRAKAAELAVYLACHPDGADTRTIGEHLEPDSRLRQADQHVHNNVSNLRHVLGRAAGFGRNAHVTKTHGRYRLDPTTIDVDLWHLHDLLHHSGLATDPQTREQLLRQACDLYTAPLAGDQDYDWIAPHRERTRRRIIHAHQQLADLLLPTWPDQAAAVLGHAVTIDPYNEQLYQHAIRAHSAAGNRDGIHRTHRALITALADLDAEPDDTTETLVTELLKTTHRL